MTFKFKQKMFQKPFAPWYDAYKGHTFKIVNSDDFGHATLVCVSESSVVVDGMVHMQDLEEVRDSLPANGI